MVLYGHMIIWTIWSPGYGVHVQNTLQKTSWNLETKVVRAWFVRLKQAMLEATKKYAILRTIQIILRTIQIILRTIQIQIQIVLHSTSIESGFDMKGQDIGGRKRGGLASF